MILLTSNGLSSQNLLNCVSEYSGDMRSAVLVTTASVGYKEKDKHIPRLSKKLRTLGLSVDFFDFDTDQPEKLLQYDLIEIIGGNPFYLLNSIGNSKAEKILETVAKEKFLVGISAGSLVLQRNIDLIAGYSLEMNEEVGLKDFTGLGLVNIEILPHYHRFLNVFERFEERAREYEIQNNCSVIRIDDGQGVLAENEKYRII